jgi:hypothetical protein
MHYRLFCLQTYFAPWVGGGVSSSSWSLPAVSTVTSTGLTPPWSGARYFGDWLSPLHHSSRNRLPLRVSMSPSVTSSSSEDVQVSGRWVPVMPEPCRVIQRAVTLQPPPVTLPEFSLIPGTAVPPRLPFAASLLAPRLSTAASSPILP